MTPEFSGGRNGWAENPLTTSTVPQGDPSCETSKTTGCQLVTIDSRVAGAIKQWAYKSPTSVYGSLPRNVPAGTSVLKVKSNPSSCKASSAAGSDCITSAAVLTVLASKPPANALRPPYMGNRKPMFVLSDFDIERDLPSLPLLSSDQHSFAKLNSSYGILSVHPNSYLTTEFRGAATPTTATTINGGNMSYGCDYGMWITGSLLMLSQQGTRAQKEKVFHHAITNAIDHYYAISSNLNYKSGGCIIHGRKALIMWGGKILSRLNQGANQSAAADMAAFKGGIEALDEMTYRSGVTGEPLWGLPPCLSDPTGSNTTARHCDQRRDGGGSKEGSGAKGHDVIQDTPAQQRAAGKYSYAAYQMMTAVYFGAAAVARVYDFESTWNNARSDRSDAFFAYVDRIAEPPWNRKCHSHCDSYLTSMHREFGCNSAICATRRGSSAPSPSPRLPAPSWSN